ncbi:MAG: glutamate synthase subunit beta [Chloroflexota bacterium]
MANPRGFITIDRIESGYRPVHERVKDFKEVEAMLPEKDRKLQASRCMDCGVPFCHSGCPVGNLMPEWQDKITQGDWKAAYEILQSTDNFPEFTGRICPALCESACVVAIDMPAVTIRENELSVIERAFAEGYVQPKPPARRSGKRVAVIGSGPAGLACADSLNQAGHSVVLYEAADRLGGFMRYGVPDFKLDKSVIDRRVAILEQEGIVFKTSVNVGKDVTVEELKQQFDAVCIAIGSRKAREIRVEGHDLQGIHQATLYLEQQNRLVAGDEIPDAERITAEQKHVVVLGGGDTGSDCIGTANRQGAKGITQIEILPPAPKTRAPNEPWPIFAKVYKNTSSHEEGCERLFNISTLKFIGEDGKVKKLLAAQVEWKRDEKGQFSMVELPGTEFEVAADLVVLAMGFEHVVHEGLADAFGIAYGPRGNVHVNGHYMTNVDGVFAAGDAKRGASLVVWAIQEGREAAKAINAYLNRPAMTDTARSEAITV